MALSGIERLETHRGYELFGGSQREPGRDAESFWVGVCEPESHERLFTEVVTMSGTAIAVKFGGRNSGGQAALFMKNLALQRARARFDMFLYGQQDPYVYEIMAADLQSIGKDNPEVADSEVEIALLEALHRIRRYAPKEYRWSLLDLDGFCSHMKVSRERVTYIAGKLEEGGFVKEVELGDEGYYITSTGIVHLQSMVEVSQGTPDGPKPSETQEVAEMPDTSRIFVIHGRNQRLADDMFNFLRAVGLHPMEWTEVRKLTGKGSPSVRDILDAAFENAHAVVALFTPDDLVVLDKRFWQEHDPDYEHRPTGQARPNVLFETGMAMARNPDRTIIAHVGLLRPFTDAEGIHRVQLSRSAASKKLFVDALSTIGCNIDTSGTQWLGDEMFRFEEAT